jgi:hypothetical protein
MGEVEVPMVFPVAGKCSWRDTFLAPRTGHRHHGQDLMGQKMTPMVACFDGTVKLGRPRSPGGHMWVTLKGDNGWTAQYYHVNNDTPGTDDGAGLDAHAFADGLRDGDHVVAGQLIAYMGDSGNAEGTAPHVHFELWERANNACVNPTASLRAAQKPDQAKAPADRPARSTLEGTVLAVDGPGRRVKVRSESLTSAGEAPDLRRRNLWVAVAKDAQVVVMEDDGVAMDLDVLLPGCAVRLEMRSKPGLAPWAHKVSYSIR